MTRNTTGKVVRIHEAGLCFVEEIGSSTVHAFTFDKIEGYGGQSAEELGLTVGCTILFAIVGGRVSTVALAAEKGA
jgi:hypothetical protein